MRYRAIREHDRRDPIVEQRVVLAGSPLQRGLPWDWRGRFQTCA